MGGSASVFDGLSVGIPCVTVEGDIPENKGAASILNALNLDDFIAGDWYEYEKKIISLAKNPKKLVAAKNATKKALIENNTANLKNFISAFESTVLDYIVEKFMCPIGGEEK
jgi:predicted O-linked N-acetylglucosamine transferase (SPINDLY family)